MATVGDVLPLPGALSWRERTVLSSLPSNRWVDRRTLSDWHGFDVRGVLDALFDRRLVMKAGDTWKRK